MQVTCYLVHNSRPCKSCMHIEDIAGFFSSFSQDSCTIVYLAGKLQDSCMKYGMILARCTTFSLQELSKILAQVFSKTLHYSLSCRKTARFLHESEQGSCTRLSKNRNCSYLVLVVPPLVLLDCVCPTVRCYFN